jgi:hypothetical protein
MLSFVDGPKANAATKGKATMYSNKEITVATGWQETTQPLFDALQAAGLKPRLIREPNDAGVATCILVPRTKAAKLALFAAGWNAGAAAAERPFYGQLARCSAA